MGKRKCTDSSRRRTCAARPLPWPSPKPLPRLSSPRRTTTPKPTFSTTSSPILGYRRGYYSQVAQGKTTCLLLLRSSWKLTACYKGEHLYKGRHVLRSTLHSMHCIYVTGFSSLIVTLRLTAVPPTITKFSCKANASIIIPAFMVFAKLLSGLHYNSSCAVRLWAPGNETAPRAAGEGRLA